jgi:pimeloyl-ACP methyl ester carboxylesterase
MGHSMGALVAWEYIKTYGQDALSGMIIVDMTPCMIERPDWKLSLYRGYSSADNQDFISKLKHDFVSTVCDLIVSGKVLSESERLQVVNQEMMKIRKNRIAKLDPEAWITCWESFVHKDYRSVLSGITLPSLLTYGEKSNFYGPEIAHYVHQNIAGSRLVMFEGAGHSPQMEQPDRFAGEIQCFLKDHFS